MAAKRIHSGLSNHQWGQNTLETPFDQDLSEYECFRKRIKKDLDSYHEENSEEEHLFGEMVSQTDNNLGTNNLYAQEFQNLRACSFKTISKIGQQKCYPFSKNQVAQYDEKYCSANKKKRQSLAHLSEQNSVHKETASKNMVRSSRKKIVSFGSMNQISKMQKRSSLDGGRFNGLVDRMRKRESSFSAMGSGSLRSINTQMMNEIYDFTINDQNELDQIYLNKMVETALIKNVRFSANLYIKFRDRKNEEKYYQSLKMYKLLDVDGFSITGFYAQSQKVRFNLQRAMTNKQFEKKFVLQPQPHSNIKDKSKQEFARQHGVQFEGSYYNFQNQKYEQAKMYLCEVKDNINYQAINSNEIQNVNYENWMMPRDTFDCSFAFSGFTASKPNTHQNS